MGVKRTPDLLPFCHPIAVTGAEVRVEPDEASGRIRVWTRVRARDRTGVEMEALTAAAVAALSLYDTAKAYDRAARIDGLRLLAKSGGKSGDYAASELIRLRSGLSRQARRYRQEVRTPLRDACLPVKRRSTL